MAPPQAAVILLVTAFWSFIPLSDHWIVLQPKARCDPGRERSKVTSAITLHQQKTLCHLSLWRSLSLLMISPLPLLPPLLPWCPKRLPALIALIWGLVGGTNSPLDSESLELELLGSANASLCVPFMFTPNPSDKLLVQQLKKEYTASLWCRFVAQIDTASTFEYKPLSLPYGVFLTCGDRAWAGIPSRLIGGPCTFGWLSLFTPHKTQTNNWISKNVTLNLAYSKRDLKNLDP